MSARAPTNANAFWVATADQLVYTAGNVLLTLAWAGIYDTSEFGLLALATTIGLVVGVSSRAYWCDPLAVAGSHPQTRTLTIVCSAMPASFAAAGGFTLALWPVITDGWRLRIAPPAVALAVSLAAFEVLRGAGLAVRRYRDTLMIDLMWLAIAAGGVATVWILDLDLLWGFVASTAPSVGTLLLWKCREAKIDGLVTPSWPRERVRQGLHYALDFWLLNGMLQATVVAVGLASGSAELGKFRLAVTVLGPIGVSVRFVQVSLLPMIAERIRTGRTSPRKVGLLAASGLGLMSFCYLAALLLVIQVRPHVLAIEAKIVAVLGVAKALESISAGAMVALKAAAVLVRATMLNAITAALTVLLMLVLRSRLSALNASWMSVAVAVVGLLMWAGAVLTVSSDKQSRDGRALPASKRLESG